MHLSPELRKKLELYSLYSRRRILGSRQGAHRSLRKGHGTEFSDYRRYVPGDSPRHIDWGVYARTDRLYVKQFHEEEELTALIILDPSGSMSLKNGAFSKWDVACGFALAMTSIALKRQDKIRIQILNGPASSLFFGASALRNAARFLSGIDIHDDTVKTGSSLSTSLRQAAKFVKFPGLALLVTDFMFPVDQLDSGLLALRAKNVELHLIKLNFREDKEPFPGEHGAIVHDNETGEEFSIGLSAKEREEYKEAYTTHESELEEYTSAIGANLSHVTISESLDSTILEILATGRFLQ